MTRDRDAARLAREAGTLGPWFHNLHLPGGVTTAPDHPLGDFPGFKWRQLRDHLPSDLRGWRALDVGCNAGFYSFELARRGAEVVGIDVDERYLAQARWAAGLHGLPNVAFRRQEVYDLANTRDRFDLVLFMGVFYHLRHPLLALDVLAELAPRLLVFQTLTHGDEAVSPHAREDGGYDHRDRLDQPGWPRLAFVETTFEGDPTNWWVPNHAAVLAMLRSAGFAVTSRPGHEIYLCRRAADGGSAPEPPPRASGPWNP